MSEQGPESVNLNQGESVRVGAGETTGAPCGPNARDRAIMAAGRTYVNMMQVWRPVVYTILGVALFLGILSAAGGISFRTNDPTRVDAGMFRRWSFNRDNDRDIELKPRLFQGVEAFKHTKVGTYRKEYDSEGPIWRPTGPQR